MSRGFFFDNTRCTGCKTCVLACKDYHDHGTEIAFRSVLDYEGGSWQISDTGVPTQDAYVYHISLACNHCDRPICTRVCPTRAMHKDDLGLVWPDAKKCIGCGYCTMACPYHAPHIDQHLKQSSKCDGCRSRTAQNLAPICIAACPVRALDFGKVVELEKRHPHTIRSIKPLPLEETTIPNLFIKPSPAALRAEDGSGKIANRKEAGLE